MLAVPMGIISPRVKEIAGFCWSLGALPSLLAIIPLLAIYQDSWKDHVGFQMLFLHQYLLKDDMPKRRRSPLGEAMIMIKTNLLLSQSIPKTPGLTLDAQIHFLHQQKHFLHLGHGF